MHELKSIIKQLGARAKYDQMTTPAGHILSFSNSFAAEFIHFCKLNETRVSAMETL